ncbi:hypothetical protein [Glycomyces rhizosphaerae]|uniref:Uncharacterized protein n=1 Tax=Glycomyces rhizosphaerae TaxID=2054422 RepID=A0ABV7Q8W0_9ACTN
MDPILLTIATAAAGKAAEVLAQNGADVTRKAVDAVRRRFGGGDAIAGIEPLAATINETCASEPEFRSELEGIIGRPIQVTNIVKFQNNFHGDGPKNVVQADTINGLTLN